LAAERAGQSPDPQLAAISRYLDRHRDDGLGDLAAVRHLAKRSPSAPVDHSESVDHSEPVDRSAPVDHSEPVEQSQPVDHRQLGDHQQAISHRQSATDRTAWPLRPEDGFFVHVEDDTNAQHVGVVLATRPRPGSAPLTAAALRAIVGASIDRLPTLRRRMVRRGPFRRPGWVVDPTVDLRRHIIEWRVAGGAEVQRSLDRFWSEPLPADRPAWQAVVIRRTDSYEALIGFKFHHALGDAISLMTTLDKVFGQTDKRRLRPERSKTPARLGLSLRRAAHTTRGLVSLARHAGAPQLELNQQPANGARGLVTLSVPSTAIRTLGGAEPSRSSERLLGLLAEAIHRCGIAGDKRAGFARTMLPVAMQLSGGRRTAGNRTGVVAVDLPLGDMSLPDRIRAIRHDLRRRMDRGEPEAGAFVMRVFGELPAPLHRRLARLVYTDRFFGLLTSYLPGPPERRLLGDNVITDVYPVLALADRVRIAVGILRYAGSTEICLVFDDAVRSEALGLRNALIMVLAENGIAATPGPTTRAIQEAAS